MACMANTDPVVDSPEQIQYIREKALPGQRGPCLSCGRGLHGPAGKSSPTRTR